MSSNKLVVCPYDEAHKVKESRIQLHIAKCKLNHLDQGTQSVCPFNATHVCPQQEMHYHLNTCPDRGILERSRVHMSQNNPIKGRTAVPSYSEPISVDAEEVWDLEEEHAGYRPTKEVPIGAIIQPEPLSKPASRRQLYKELHQMSSELDARSNAATMASPVPRQPKQPSEAEKNFEDQSVNQQRLGLGRGNSSSRIAANIFSQPTKVNTAAPAQKNYSAVISGMSNLSLGRGISNRAVGDRVILNDDDFPALGVGRGSPRNPPRQEFKAPGSRW